jgi:hypothetical protein
MTSYGYIMRPDSRLRLWNWNVSFKRDSQLAGVTGPRSHSPLASLTIFAGLNVNLSSTSYISIIYAYHNGHMFH